MIRVDITAGHPAFDGHFPEHPILPGVCILHYVVQAYQKPNRGFRNVKFMKPVHPGDTLDITLNETKQDATRFTVTVCNDLVCEGQILSEAKDV